MQFIRFMEKRLGIFMANINHASEFFRPNLGTDLKYLKKKWGVVETLPSSPGTRAYKTKDGDIIKIYSTDNSLEIVSDAISMTKPVKDIKDGTFIGATKMYRNLAYPDIGKNGIVSIDRDKTFYYYKQGAFGTTIPYYGFQKDIVSNYKYDTKMIPLPKAVDKNLKFDTIAGGWRTPLNIAIAS